MRGLSMGRLASLGLVLAVGGCATTELEVRRAQESSEAGAPYSLYFTQYDVTVTRTIVSCGPLQVEVAVSATPSAIPDPAERYTVDLDSLSGPFKTSDVKLDYHGHDRLKALNASAEDRSGAAIKAAAGLVSKVIQVGTGGAAAPAPGGCVERLAAYKLASAAVERETALAASQRAAVRDLTLDVAGAQGARAATLKRRLAEASKTLERTGDRLTNATSALAEAKKKVTHVETLKWPHTGALTEGVSEIPHDTLTAWTAGEALQGPDAATRLAGARQRLALNLALEAQNEATGTFRPAVITAVDARRGLPYRHSRPGRLVVRDQDGKLSGTFPSELQQIGPVFYFPVVNRPFQKNKFSLALTEAGELESVGYVDEAARGEGALAAVKEVVDQGATTYVAMRDAETRALTREAERLKAQKAVADAKKALTPSAAAAETAELNEQIALLKARQSAVEADVPGLGDLNAQLVYKKAELELVKVNDSLSPREVVRETTALNEQIAKLEAQQKATKLASPARVQLDAISGDLAAKKAELELIGVQEDLAKARAAASS